MQYFKNVKQNDLTKWSLTSSLTYLHFAHRQNTNTGGIKTPHHVTDINSQCIAS